MVAESERSSPEDTLPNPFLVAIGLGLSAGLVEVALWGVAKLVLHRYPLFRDAHTVWAAPVSLSILLAVAALPFAALDGGRRRAFVRPAALVTLASFAAFDVLLLATQLHWLARMVLAIGLGVTSGRVWRRNPSRSARGFGRATWVLVATVLLLGIGTFGMLRVQEARREGALPPSDAFAPNVLLIILDTVRAANLGLYGYARATTPQLSRFATRGAVFDRAVSPSSWTLPSHASIFTGRWAAELSTDWNSPLDSRDPTLAEVLAARGYRTAGFAANIYFTSTESGLARGFIHYDDYPLTVGTIALASALGHYISNHRGIRAMLRWDAIPGRKTGLLIRENIEAWVGSHHDRPFFVFANFFDAHDPYIAAPPYDTLFTGRRLRWDELDHSRSPERPLPRSILRNEQAMYDGAIASLDAELGRLLADLEASGTLRNTIVVVTADHGEEFFEHGMMDHGNSLYLPSVHVPLIVVAPRGVPAGVRVPQWVSLRDVASTILDLAGAPPSLPGRSLARYWNGTAISDTLFMEVRRATDLPPAFPVSRGDVKSALAGNWKLITIGGDSEELFDVATDSMETRNRSQDSVIPLARLREALRNGPLRQRR